MMIGTGTPFPLGVKQGQNTHMSLILCKTSCQWEQRLLPFSLSETFIADKKYSILLCNKYHYNIASGATMHSSYHQWVNVPAVGVNHMIFHSQFPLVGLSSYTMLKEGCSIVHMVEH